MTSGLVGPICSGVRFVCHADDLVVRSRRRGRRRVMTVVSPSTRRSAISALLNPRPTSSRICRSRSVSAARLVVASGAGPRRWRSISLRVRAGASSVSPAATVRMGGQQLVAQCVLQQEAAGPGAQRLVDVGVRVVGGKHQDPGAAVRSAGQLAGASMPSSSGIRTSITITSGRNWRASRTASRPVAASPTTSSSGRRR